MPMKPKRPCSWPDCLKLTVSRYYVAFQLATGMKKRNTHILVAKDFRESAEVEC